MRCIRCAGISGFLLGVFRAVFMYTNTLRNTLQTCCRSCDRRDKPLVCRTSLGGLRPISTSASSSGSLTPSIYWNCIGVCCSLCFLQVCTGSPITSFSDICRSASRPSNSFSSASCIRYVSCHLIWWYWTATVVMSILITIAARRERSKLLLLRSRSWVFRLCGRNLLSFCVSILIVGHSVDSYILSFHCRYQRRSTL